MSDFSAEVAQLKKGLGRTLKGCFLAGGAITSLLTGKKIRDYDLYFKSKDHFLKALASMYEDGCWCVAVTPRAITFVENNETVFQLMSFAWFETPEQIFDKFDFTCCMGAIDLEGDTLARHKDFVRDIARRKLQFNHGTEFPVGSALRVRKYVSRGYSIDDSEYLKIILACSFKEIKDWDDLKNQIGGQYGEAVTLDTSKPFTLDSAVISLGSAISVPSSAGSGSVAASYEDAVKMIFPEE